MLSIMRKTFNAPFLKYINAASMPFYIFELKMSLEKLSFYDVGTKD